ncbi:MAG: ExbD/TolR family protein [bacterium]
MSRRKVRYRKDLMAEVNITNLIDVVMVLLIVFILVANFVQTGLNISIPEVRYVESIGQQKIVVGVDIDGNLTLNSELVGKDELVDRLKDLKQKYPEEGLYLMADRMSILDHSANVWSSAGEAGFKQIYFPANFFKDNPPSR